MRNPDVQALVYASFAPLRHCRYLLLRVTDAAAARRWLGQSAVLDLVRGGDGLRGDAVQGEVLAMAFIKTTRPSSRHPWLLATSLGRFHILYRRPVWPPPMQTNSWRLPHGHN